MLLATRRAPAPRCRGSTRRSRRRRHVSRDALTALQLHEVSTLASAVVASPWFGLYLPQLRMSFDRILERTLIAEAAGFDSIWLMDHLAAPMAPDVDTFEGWTIASALAARTTRI